MILVTTGTDGDVFPFIGLGAALVARGHRVTLATSANYEGLAAAHGCEFRALISEEENQDLIAHPDFWHPIKTALVSLKWGVGLFEREYAVLAELARGQDCLIVSHVAVLAARMVQEKLGRPMANLLLQPWVIPSVFEPPVMPAGLTLPRWAPRPLGRLYFRLISAAGDLFVARHLNVVRANLGLKPVRHMLQWWLSPDLVIGLFPACFAPPQPDWPPQVRLAGFSRFDGQKGALLPPEVLDYCRAGEPPVVFTFGTGMMHSAHLFRASVEACQLAGLRGLLLTRYADQLPAELPPCVRHFPFAPFRQLFPHCAAVVHHGGVGTTARAFAAGIPQLILPLALDQHDNASRVERLGAGVWLRRRQRRGSDMARALRRLLTSEVKAHCRAFAAQAENEDGLEVAARWLEEMGRTRLPTNGTTAGAKALSPYVFDNRDNRPIPTVNG
jgi:UDP:flavonoid glycosyltransferase YjiC (YdhE family)